MKDIEQQHVGWRDSKIFGAEQENLTGSRSVDLKSWMNFGEQSHLTIVGWLGGKNPRGILELMAPKRDDFALGWATRNPLEESQVRNLCK